MSYEVKVLVISQFQNPIIAQVKREDNSLEFKNPMIVISNKTDNQAYLAPFPPLARKDQSFYIAFDHVILQYEATAEVIKKYKDITGE